MRISEKLKLVDKIGRTLQSRYSYVEIDRFLGEFGVSPPKNFSSNSKWLYSKEALKGAPDSLVLRIAEELELAGPSSNASLSAPPRNWAGTNQFRLFISHVSKDKLKATRLKECLLPYNILGFVAHKDIEPTLEWQEEIERALRTMDAFIAIHTRDFSNSIWTQQEIGFALGRGVKIIFFKMGEDPKGFISKRQALARGERKAEEIAKEVVKLLRSDSLTSERLAEAQMPQDQDDIPF